MLCDSWMWYYTVVRSIPPVLAQIGMTMHNQPTPITINLGTSSWQFDGWRGVFYPEGLPRQAQLAHYAQHFNTVETNTSFYGLPRPATLVNWVETVPQGFTFCLKFPRSISHEKRLVGCEAETAAFLDVLRALGPAAAPAFLQLPPDFTRTQHGRALANYLDWLAPQLEGQPIGVEVRARDLMTGAFARFLAERGMALVVVDREGWPDLYPIWDELVQADVAPNFAILRWIGDDKNGPKGDDQLVFARDNQLAQWAARLVAWQQAGVTLFGYMHNPWEAPPPARARGSQARFASLPTLPPWPPANAADEPQTQLPLL